MGIEDKIVMVQHVNVENPVDSIVDTSGRPNNEVL